MSVLASMTAAGAASMIQLTCPAVTVGEMTLTLNATVEVERQLEPAGWSVKFRSIGPEEIAGWGSVPTVVRPKQVSKPLLFAHQIRPNGAPVMLTLSVPGGVENLAKLPLHFEAYSYSAAPNFEKRVLAAVDCRIVESGRAT